MSLSPRTSFHLTKAFLMYSIIWFPSKTLLDIKILSKVENMVASGNQNVWRVTSSGVLRTQLLICGLEKGETTFNEVNSKVFLACHNFFLLHLIFSPFLCPTCSNQSNQNSHPFLATRLRKCSTPDYVWRNTTEIYGSYSIVLYILIQARITTIMLAMTSRGCLESRKLKLSQSR
jgi:hypothetical protein